MGQMTRTHYGVATLAPMPADPTICRWCRRDLSRYGDGTPFCEAGCEANDTPLFTGHCQTCARSFETGSKWKTDECWECDTRSTNTMIAAEAGGAMRATGYTVDMTRKAVNRRDADARAAEKKDAA